jgi:ABC-type sugar transport system ATPase subunit
VSSLYELRGVAKTFGSGAAQVHAVHEVDLTIEQGEFGALDRPTSGEVHFEGRDLGGLRDAELTPPMPSPQRILNRRFAGLSGGSQRQRVPYDKYFPGGN